VTTIHFASSTTHANCNDLSAPARVRVQLSLRSRAGGRLVRVTGVVSQRRVIAVDLQTDRVLAVPLDCRETFAVRDGRTRRFTSESFIRHDTSVRFCREYVEQFVEGAPVPTLI